MRLYALAVYLFLYLPIAIIAIFSFNAGRHASQFTGFSLQWYGKALWPAAGFVDTKIRS